MCVNQGHEQSPGGYLMFEAAYVRYVCGVGDVRYMV